MINILEKQDSHTHTRTQNTVDSQKTKRREQSIINTKENHQITIEKRIEKRNIKTMEKQGLKWQ